MRSENRLTQRIDMLEAYDYRCAGCPVLIQEDIDNSFNDLHRNPLSLLATSKQLCKFLFAPDYIMHNEPGCRKGFLRQDRLLCVADKS